MAALSSGAAVSMRRRFSASGWLSDVRRYGVTYWNYTGKPLAYLLAQPPRPDDADNPLRVAYGNEGAPSLVAAFAERFGVEVIDAFGATEGGLAVTRSDGDPPGAMGVPAPGVTVVDEAGRPLPAARFGPAGELLDPVGCVGEIVNTAGVGVFEGYYNNDEANARATRNGWYWSGDLGYVDEAGYLYFAGRNADWIRVDGENFPAGPIQDAIARHPDLMVAVVYGVPDPDAGDQVMAAVVPVDGATLDPQELAVWLDAQPDLAPKWRPRYVRVSAGLPVSPTNKVLTRTLVHEKYRPDRTGDDVVWVRDRGAAAFRLFTDQDARELRAALEQRGRARGSGICELSAMIDILAVNVGVPRLLAQQRGQRIYSAIAKQPVDAGATLWLSMGNLAGDAQADLVVHGGADKALYTYPSEHLAPWASELGEELGAAPFGENLSTSGALETDVGVGDVWRWDDALIQVCQPRWPCFKLALHRRRPDIQKRMRGNGRTGWYHRVLEPGEVVVGSPVELVSKDPSRSHHRRRARGDG